MTSVPARRTRPRSPADRTGAPVKVPQVIALFWITKALTTAFGESASDWLVHVLPPAAAVLLGLILFAGTLTLQLRSTTYSAVRYWLAVAMVGVFGTMAADVLHVGLHVPYTVSAVTFAVLLAAVFVCWRQVEGTVSVHSITTTRRELFYWSAVVVTFALGTALGDLAATTGGLGYFPSAVVFAVLIMVPALGYRFFRLDGVVAFWAAYVLTRPVGASVADWLGKPAGAHGLGLGSGPVAAALAVMIIGAVVYLAVSGADAPVPLSPPALTAADGYPSA